jgi:4-diphosphocytidyl-2-C-methyl-D-erythritol kinase
MLIQDLSDNLLVLLTPAKVNLFLEVLNKREDGYHNINSLFVAVSLFDTLEFRRTDSHGIYLALTGQNPLSIGQDNLISKSWNLMSERFGIGGGLDVILTKRIPVAAGLGGGSSDASATIFACNHLFHLGLSHTEMAELSAEIGSDCPFFFSSGSSIVSGRGEIIDDIQIPTGFWLVLVKPAISVSTAYAYGQLGRCLTNYKSPFKLPSCRTVENLLSALALTGNDFEPVQFSAHDELSAVRDRLIEYGALLVRMSGSGPTIFGLFTEEPDEQKFADFINGSWQLYTVRPISLLGVHQKTGGNRGDNRSKGNLT